MATRELYHRVLEASSILPAAQTNAVEGAAVDLAGFEGALVVVDVGLYTSGSAVFSLTECDEAAGTYTAVAAGDIIGTPPTIGSTSVDNMAYCFSYVGSKRYIRVISTGTSSIVYGAVVIRHNARHQKTR